MTQPLIVGSCYIAALMLGYLLAILVLVNSAFGATLTASERSQLRFRLENLASDIELTIQNHRSDELDFKNQQRVETGLKMRERIPFAKRPSEIPKELSRSARQNGIGFSGFRFTGRKFDRAPLPRELILGEQTFRLSPDEVAESIGFSFIARVTARVGRAKLASWIRGWHHSIPRLMDPIPGKAVRSLGGSRWEVRGQAFRFRALRFPHLRLADPRSLLPSWARAHSKTFEQEEPALASIVETAEHDAPRAAPLLRFKEAFLLEDARISFFLLKAGATPDVQIN